MQVQQPSLIMDMAGEARTQAWSTAGGPLMRGRGDTQSTMADPRVRASMGIRANRPGDCSWGRGDAVAGADVRAGGSPVGGAGILGVISDG